METQAAARAVGPGPREVLAEIQDELCQRIGISRDARFFIQDPRRHRHSRSMILQTESVEDRIFVKFGAHFSGGHDWDVKSEYEGYCAVHGMDMDVRRFFSVRPLLFRETPPVLATVFVENALPLKKVMDRGLGRLFPSVAERDLIRLTQWTAQWLDRFMDLKERTAGRTPVADLIGFCVARWSEMATRGGVVLENSRGGDAMIAYLTRLFSGYVGGEAPLARNHGDFGPHNVALDREGRIGVIDIGFAPPGGHVLACEDAAAFLIYLEQMRNNPLYRPQRLERVVGAFLAQLLSSPERLAAFMPAYVKKLLAHLAWRVHPERRPGSRWQEFSFRKWSENRVEWLQHEIISVWPSGGRTARAWLYGASGRSRAMGA